MDVYVCIQQEKQLEGMEGGQACDTMKAGGGGGGNPASFFPMAAYYPPGGGGGGGSWTSHSGIWGQPSFYGNLGGGTMMMHPGGGVPYGSMMGPGGMMMKGGLAYDMESSFYWLERYAERNGLSHHHHLLQGVAPKGDNDLVYKPPAVPSWNHHVGSRDVTDEKTLPV